jgi:hypothetical protein
LEAAHHQDPRFLQSSGFPNQERCSGEARGFRGKPRILGFNQAVICRSNATLFLDLQHYVSNLFIDPILVLQFLHAEYCALLRSSEDVKLRLTRFTLSKTTFTLPTACKWQSNSRTMEVCLVLASDNWASKSFMNSVPPVLLAWRF